MPEERLQVGLDVVAKTDKAIKDVDAARKQIEDEPVQLELQIKDDQVQDVINKLQAEKSAVALDLRTEWKTSSKGLSSEYVNQINSYLQSIDNAINALSAKDVTSNDISSILAASNLKLDNETITQIQGGDSSKEVIGAINDVNELMKQWNLTMNQLSKAQEANDTANIEKLQNKLDQIAARLNKLGVDKPDGKFTQAKQDAARKQAADNSSESTVTSQLKQIVGGIIGIKTIYALVRRIAAQNENLTQSLTNITAALAQLLQPVLDLLARIINTIAKWLGFTLKEDKKISTGVSTVNKQLAPFDEINNLTTSSGSGGSTTEDETVDPGEVSWLKKILDWISDHVGEILIAIGAVLIGWATGVISAILAALNIKAIISAVSGVVTAIGTFIAGLSASAIALIAGIALVVAGVVYLIIKYWDEIGAAVQQVGKWLDEKLEAIGLWLQTELPKYLSSAWEFIKGIFTSIFTFLSNGITTIVTGVGTLFTNIGTWLGTVWNNIKNGWTNTWTAMKNFISSIPTTLSNGITSARTAISGFFNNIATSIKNAVWNNSLRRVIQAMANGVVNLVNKIPLVSVGYPSIPYLASGGIVGNGQLFMANEAGPELIGKFGNQTGVMNSDQIVEAVSQGVYEAVTSAMSGRDNNVNVYLDGRQITNSVVKNIKQQSKAVGASLF